MTVCGHLHKINTLNNLQNMSYMQLHAAKIGLNVLGAHVSVHLHTGRQLNNANNSSDSDNTTDKNLRFLQDRKKFVPVLTKCIGSTVAEIDIGLQLERSERCTLAPDKFILSCTQYF